MRDERTAWEVYYQQQPDASGVPEKQPEQAESFQTPLSVITTMARQGDTKIEVADPDLFPVGKYIVLQESLIYMVVGKGSLILARPLSRDSLTGTNVRLLTDTDQYRVESTDIYLQNPQPSHYRNGEGEIPTTPHGGNGNLGTTPHIEQMGLDVNSYSGNGGAVESDTTASPLPCGKPRPPIERVGTPAKELTLQTWLLRSHFQQNKVHWKQCHEYYGTHEPTVAELDQEHRFKPSDVERALTSLNFPSSSGSVLQVIQGIRDFEGQFVRAMKGVSLSCVLYAKLLLHGVQDHRWAWSYCNQRRHQWSRTHWYSTKKMLKRNICQPWRVRSIAGWQNMFPRLSRPRQPIERIR